MVPEARAPGCHEQNKVATFKVRDPDRGCVCVCDVFNPRQKTTIYIKKKKTKLTYSNDVRHPARVLNPHETRDQRRPVFPKHTPRTQPSVSHGRKVAGSTFFLFHPLFSSKFQRQAAPLLLINDELNTAACAFGVPRRNLRSLYLVQHLFVVVVFAAAASPPSSSRRFIRERGGEKAGKEGKAARCWMRRLPVPRGRIGDTPANRGCYN